MYWFIKIIYFYFAPFLKVTHPLLSSFSVLILKLVDLIKDLVSKAMVFEEEDFQPLVYGFSLCQVRIRQQLSSIFIRDISAFTKIKTKMDLILAVIK